MLPLRNIIRIEGWNFCESEECTQVLPCSSFSEPADSIGRKPEVQGPKKYFRSSQPSAFEGKTEKIEAGEVQRFIEE